MSKQEAGEQDRKRIRGEQERRSSVRSRKARRPAGEGFYAQNFTPEELAVLALKADADDLGDEIDLLRILIWRKMKSAKANSGAEGGADDDAAAGIDAEAIRRFVGTLCQAVRIRYSLSGKGTRNLEEAAETVLAEIVDELGKPRCAEMAQGDRVAGSDGKMEGVVIDGTG